MKRHSCKYCGISKEGHSLRCHEACCPEMKYFADFALENSCLREAFWKKNDTKVEADIGGVTTKKERIIRIIRTFKQTERK